MEPRYRHGAAVQLSDPGTAREAFEDLVARFPGTFGAPVAQERLREMAESGRR